ncbi:MAG: hypothetical protein M1840_001928 [Geoglossum simile]|nr:MAG: hypothetical protein M1840_001928 [Geoglossum simile]
MLSRSFTVVALATVSLSQLAVASPEPVITPAPEFTRDAPKIGEIVDRTSAIWNNDLKARAPDRHLEERQDFVASCGYYYVDCGDGSCCSLGEVCDKSGANTKCRFATFGDYSIDINSILESLSSLMSGLPTDYLTSFPTNSAGLSEYLASLTSLEIAAGKPTATSHGSHASSGPSFQSTEDSANKRTGLSGGTIGGIAAGSVIAIAAIISTIIFFLVRRNRKNHAAAAQPTPLQPQMAQPGYPPQNPSMQAPHTAYSQAAPPYASVENSVFMQQQQKTDNGYYNPPILGAQEVEGGLKQQGTYVPPPVGHLGLPASTQEQQPQWHQNFPLQGSHELGVNPTHMLLQPVQQHHTGQAVAAHHVLAGGAPAHVVYEMEGGVAR